MATNDFLAFAGGSGANVTAQSDYAALPAISSGYSAGTAKSAQINKTLRQSSIMAAVLAQFIANQTGANSVDDGTTATLLANLQLAVASKKGLTLRLTAVASGSFTVPAGVYSLYYKFWGVGGGGGGGGATLSGNGGGSGGYAEGWLSVTPGQVIPYVFGAVGTGGSTAGGGTGGTSGGSSSLNGTIVVGGGIGGAGGGTGGGGGGTAAGGDLLLGGNQGGGPALVNSAGTLSYGPPGGGAIGVGGNTGYGTGAGAAGRSNGAGGAGGNGGSSGANAGGNGAVGYLALWG